jgi:hypothetical protein
MKNKDADVIKEWYWYVWCEGDITFRSSISLDRAMRLWSQEGKPKVISCGSLGV